MPSQGPGLHREVNFNWARGKKPVYGTVYGQGPASHWCLWPPIFQCCFWHARSQCSADLHLMHWAVAPPRPQLEQRRFGSACLLTSFSPRAFFFAIVGVVRHLSQERFQALTFGVSNLKCCCGTQQVANGQSSTSSGACRQHCWCSIEWVITCELGSTVICTRHTPPAGAVCGATPAVGWNVCPHCAVPDP